MDQHVSGVPEDRRSAPQDWPPADPADQAGRALIDLVEQAASLSSQNCESANALAAKLAAELRAVEERNRELEAAVSHYRERARCAEAWLQRIEREVEDRLIAPLAASRSAPPTRR
jgi:hypothetical protein